MHKERDSVILVDEKNHQIGVMDKLRAHELGLLHRAFSIFIFNDNNELLLQQRASSKYHGANLWTNTCCSHPQQNESNLEAAKERLFVEMGITADLKELFSFIYKAEVENNLIEHELDFVFIGKSNQQPIINPNEVKDWKWISQDDLDNWIAQNPEQFTYWFKDIWPNIRKVISS